MKLTLFQQKALKVLIRHPGINARIFGVKMWPDSKAHRKISNGGNGAQSGKAGWLMAGSYLGKLRKKGWVRHGYRSLGERENGFYLTAKGKDIASTL